MFLKRIELAGFKSFADKTELEFVKGITAVVGPNGSGKSNISDGIRWVLGEQSARSLRGGKMEDIIFAGSDARKAVNYGEVSLTLDNSDQALPLDFNEVTVTRRVHRSGESEYLINRQSCRLKDITELFMDTGIGKEAYSIIGQGRIEEILSTKSEDRRAIFEEASGIVKYKSRKKEAEKKLDETEQNLLRIHDLTCELEDQLEPLREQAETAEKYNGLREQLKVNEISLYVYQIDQLHATWTESSAKLEKLKLDQAELAAKVSKHDAELETQRLEARRAELELEQSNERLLKVSEEFEKCEGLGEVLKERERNLAVRRQTLERQADQLASNREARQAELAELAERIKENEVKLAELRLKLREEEEKLTGVAGGAAVGEEDRLKARLLDLLNAMAQARNEIRYSEQQIEALQRRLERNAEEEGKRAAQLEQATARRKRLEEDVEAAVQAIGGIRDEYVALGGQIESRSKLCDEAQQLARKWEQKLDALTSRRDTMLEMQNDYDGFIHGVKEILKVKNKPDVLRGIHGAVAELVRVPAEVEIAVETALGGALQNIVVATEGDGRAAISFLKRRQLGRATFLPLDVIRGRDIPEQDKRLVQHSQGFVGVAADLVQYDAPYRQIVYSLLGNVLIAETLEQANHIAAQCRYRYRVVTLEGDVVNPGGSMTGGSQHKKTVSLLGRKRQIEELEQEIADSRQQQAQLYEKSKQLKQSLNELTAKLESLRQAGEQKRIEEQQLRAQIEPLKQELQALRDQSELSASDREALMQEQQELRDKCEQCQTELEALQQQESLLQQQIREAEVTRRSRETQKEELQSQLTDLKIEEASALSFGQSLSEQRRRLRSDLDGIAHEEEQVKQSLVDTGNEAAETEQERTRQIEQWNELTILKRECSEKIEFQRADRAQRAAELQAAEDETKDERQALRQTEEKLHQTEVQVARLDVELDNLLRKLAEDYELSVELARTRYPIPQDPSATQSLVKELRREIAALGSVNLGAIEEYARVGERFAFLSSQKNDLMEAKAALYQVIGEMDEEMSRRFLQTFEAVREQFVLVFAKLFGGGRADLILSEPQRLLATGIEIVAQPPGKKLQNLQLLSGGERALTAIALLFAILRIKPVPFCVLDEVEAALDEANVTRFAEYLREFSMETQFIVVTHRKGTMEEADVLYGVTMEEGGVSKLVSVRLDDEAGLESA